MWWTTSQKSFQFEYLYGHHGGKTAIVKTVLVGSAADLAAGFEEACSNKVTIHAEDYALDELTIVFSHILYCYHMLHA